MSEAKVSGDGSVDRRTERRLITQAKRGDRVAMRALIDAHKDSLFAFVWRTIRNHHDAEEVCQDAFLRAFTSLQSFSSEYRFSTWLFTIAYRLALNSLRRKKALSGDIAGARKAYEDFFELWKDADEDIPLLQEAREEYGKL